MSKLRIVFTMAALLLASSNASAASWRTAYTVSNANYCSYPYCQCVYEELLSRMRFNVTMESVYCPVSIQINPETRQWKQY
ncbi:hypothetical protein [Moraxella marmotae]|uniref:hypothetical protein n=1 Tax=Moraxella marmotae TaxID=3344520 RepID=UPI0035F34753